MPATSRFFSEFEFIENAGTVSRPHPILLKGNGNQGKFAQVLVFTKVAA
jgi:hypothetical protein